MHPNPNPNPNPNPDQAGTQQAVTAVQAHGAAMEQLATARYREIQGDVGRCREM
jgi:hypothetical protein